MPTSIFTPRKPGKPPTLGNNPGPVAPVPVAPGRGGADGRGALPSLMPEVQILTGEFHRIEVPGGEGEDGPLGLDFGAGNAAWYGLARKKINNARAVQLTGAVIQMLPTDPLGTQTTICGGAERPAVKWGSRLGLGAALVIGRNLPFDNVKTWQKGPADIAGLRITAGSGTNELDVNDVKADGTRYTRVVPFPPGSMSDSIPYRQVLQMSFGVAVDRFDLDDTLDVALVVDPRFGQTDGLTGRDTPSVLVGYGHVTLYMQLG